MLKKLLPLALSVVIIGGCAAYKEATSFQQGFQTFLVRTLTLNQGGSENAQAFLIWAGTKPLTSLSVKDGNSAAQPIPFQDANHTATASVRGGSNFTFDAGFDGGKTFSRDIKPYTIGDAGTITADSPVTNDPVALAQGNATVVNSKRPTFSYTTQGTPNGYLITVGEAPAVLTGTSADRNANITPLYTAFLSAASHSTSVAYGTPSDFNSLTSEMAGLLSKMDKRFAQKDQNVPDLVSGKTYMWLISPLKVDDQAVRFAIGDQAYGVFKVQ